MHLHKIDLLWEKISTLGVDSKIGGEELIRLRILNQVTVAGLIACLVSAPAYIYDACWELLIIDFICMLLALVVLFLNYRGKNELAWHVGLIGIPTLLAGISFIIQPVPGLALIVLSFIIIIRYLYQDRNIKKFYYFYYGLTAILIVLSPVFGGRYLEYHLLHNLVQSLIGVSLHILFSDFLSKELSKREASLKANEERIVNLLEELKLKNTDLEGKVRDRTSSLLKTNAELQRSNEELRRFAYATSHDLQEPLRMIGSFVQLLNKRYGDKLDQDGKDYIQYALEGSTRISALIRSILKYEELGEETMKVQLVNFKSLIEKGIKGLMPIIEEKNARVDIEGIPDEIHCEPDEMSLVFYNLIHNGLTFNKSKIPKIIIKGEENPTHWLISVQDNGIGIAPQYVDRVFRVFQRLNSRKEYSGPGMGLPLCQRIVERHNGKIWLTSEEGAGTTFFLTINKFVKPQLELV